MTYLAIEAHGLTDEFEAAIKSDFDVVVADRQGEPLCVVFKGKRASLVRMYNKHWALDDPALGLEYDSPWLFERYRTAAAHSQ